AVVELHAAPQLEDECLGVRLRPRLGQPRLDAELVVERDDGLEDVVVDLAVDLAAREMRIHRGGLDVEAHPQRATLLWSLRGLGRLGPRHRGPQPGRHRTELQEATPRDPRRHPRLLIVHPGPGRWSGPHYSGVSRSRLL